MTVYFYPIVAQLASGRNRQAVEVTPKPCAPSDDILADGTQRIVTADCSVKLVSLDGKTSTLTYPNGEEVTRWEDPDLLRSVTITKKADGPKITEEIKGAEKTITIETPDGQKAVKTPNGLVITTYPDGKTVTSDPKGSTTTSYPGGKVIIDYLENYQGEEFAGFKYKPKQDTFDPTTGETVRTHYGTDMVLILKAGTVQGMIKPDVPTTP